MVVLVPSNPALVLSRSANANQLPRDVNEYVDHICRRMKAMHSGSCSCRFPHLKISHNDLSDAHAETLASALSSITPRENVDLWTLRIVECQKLTASGHSCLIDAFLSSAVDGGIDKASCGSDHFLAREHSSCTASEDIIRKSNNVKKRLILDSIRLDGQSLRQLADCFASHARSPCLALTELTLERCHLSKTADWRILFETLSCLDLECLDLSENDLDNEDVSALFRYLVHNAPTKLHTLSLAANPRIGDVGVSELCKLLLKRPDCAIASVNLGDCHVTSASLRELAKCVRDGNANLSRLHFYGNEFPCFETRRQLNYSLELNSRGRALIRKGERVAETLSKVQNQPHYMYGLLRDSPHQWAN